jgi:hypothetical protein
MYPDPGAKAAAITCNTQEPSFTIDVSTSHVLEIYGLSCFAQVANAVVTLLAVFVI